ncbi:ABC-type Fe3+ transport system, periplasmic component OS=Singulisphaera acidiphila (strain ATCC BAA-1392 / DSM 18658 / VKM B-2454 / MOB10) GN=Sinac_4929 PE=4 SV=1: SBP_bac_6 [Gemmataceae bacterium]|nr:ABC-type Fe3+ transport system, periplasmic component OS=Singulisphaera acidiphila (strain ATCC BAA-1392 / DSM 18658 / VKM B-2454 / MOB10) GN=Sinac_4929 PE=4 SV=1: SBP_bac_6 [Gemmataceae bacterium]VTT98016.1 ABC-type Fe3+ transport system, periplasmic component OS=Singulisphaera acidiphila (strain ATCC BAA-1392 / DSM 18658 / VKM B-2454 / MOB10) GN=Sinac_4929 PE=4 SV=1: SBP_bac_6 [Gemmataceae bacterium]
MTRRHFIAGSVALAAGCGARGDRVVLYCAQDREFADDLLAEFTRETGLRVDTKFDTEANKSVALAAELEQEAGRPRCDVHWNNEPLGSVRLARAGVYAPLPAPLGDAFPAATRPADRTWQGFAARARVLVVNLAAVTQAEQPLGLFDLLAEKWRGRVAIAKPFFGTTATHAAALSAALGAAKAREFFAGLKANGASVVAGNKQVARAVADGRFAVGLTDTDDALIEVRAGKPVAVVFPDAAGFGTLFLPNTVALVKGGPNPAGAQKLVEFLLRPATEQRLAEGGGFQIPLNPAVTAALAVGLKTPSQTRPMDVNFDAAADAWEGTQAMLRELFAG